MGEALWDLLAPPGVGFAEAPSLRLQPGGAAVNVALALAKEQFQVGLAAAVGDDALGRALAARVAAGGVDTSTVRRVPERTGLVFVERAEQGRCVVAYRPPEGPRLELQPGFAARALLLTGLLPEKEHAAGFRAAARAARRAGALVVLDVNARPRPWAGRDPRPALAAIRDADVVKASRDDLAVMGLRKPDDVRRYMRRDAALVVTAGADPARAFGGFGEISVAAEPAAAGDAMGAGDAFMAGLIATTLRAGGRLEHHADAWVHALHHAHTWARAHLAC
jgi:sugar/nucleoside kinase (ribokinase family)